MNPLTNFVLIIMMIELNFVTIRFNFTILITLLICSNHSLSRNRIDFPINVLRLLNHNSTASLFIDAYVTNN